MTDIRSRDDIELLIRAFYEKVTKDELLASHFHHVNWEKHLPVMFDFWESVLFFIATYSGNPMQVHKSLHSRMPISSGHFSRWKELFIQTVRENFEGEKADLAISRADSIAYLMEQKLG